jgi:DNA-binding PucR family transcriptional regulator
VPASRETADQVLRVLRSEQNHRRVADLGDVRASALVLRFADACAGDPALASGPVARLTEHDEQRHTAFVATLRAYLDSFGDVEATARSLAVHPNTVRYRLKQLQSVSGIDLEDSSERLVLMLELQLVAPL